MTNTRGADDGISPGDILAGKYRVERVLGSGGMGLVVAAHHLQLDERVALKFLLPHALGQAEAVARFLREARAAVKIKSEHVARVSDVGTLPDGAPYMVMEYLEGGDLAAWLQQRGALPIEQAVEFVLQACVAVADAHALGIVHRDLKPANLFCVRRSDGQLSIKVIDFGISKLTHPEGSTGPGANISMTRTASMMGSPLYMSPEQMRSSKEVDAGTDIWSLGVILFELIARRPVFFAESVTELAIRVANEPAPSLRELRPEVPAGLEAVIFRCLEKDRRHRYPNVGELAIALLPFAPRRAKVSVDRISGIIRAAGLSESALAVPPSPLDGGSHAPASKTLDPIGRTTLGGGRRKVVVGGALAATALAAAVLGASWMLRASKSDVRHDAAQTAASSLPSSPVAAPAPVPTPPPVEAQMAPPPPPTEALPPAPGPGSVSPPARAMTADPPRVAAPVHPIAPTASPPPRAGGHCDPPYHVDARGNRVFKPECL